jgi:hypothetical protein
MDQIRISVSDPSSDQVFIRFALYIDLAPATVKSFISILPFSRTYYHARLSGFEIWTEDGPKLDLPQENASIYAEPGEIVLGPIHPARNKIADCIGIFYGKGRLLDCGNIFGKVVDEDFHLLKSLGDSIWREGGKMLKIELFQAT